MEGLPKIASDPGARTAGRLPVAAHLSACGAPPRAPPDGPDAVAGGISGVAGALAGSWTGEIADAKRAAPRQAGGMRTLLVDDHANARAACRALLETEGIEVLGELPVSDDAIEAAAALAPDVILLDVGLADQRALALARRLQLTSTVVLTSSADRERLGMALAGFPFVEKMHVSAARLGPGDFAGASQRPTA